MRAAGFLALTAAFALASWLGWWTVPVLGFIWGMLNPPPPAGSSGRPSVAAALAALLGWAGWLGLNLAAGYDGFGRIGAGIAGTLGVPFPVPLLATLLLPALLAGTAAAIGTGLAGFLPRSRPVPG